MKNETHTISQTGEQDCRAQLCSILIKHALSFKKLIRSQDQTFRSGKTRDLSSSITKIHDVCFDLHELWKDLIHMLYDDLRIRSHTWTPEELDIWIWVTKYVTNVIRISYIFVEPIRWASKFDQIFVALGSVESEMVRLLSKQMPYSDQTPEELKKAYFPRIPNDRPVTVESFRRVLTKWLAEEGKDKTMICGERGIPLNPEDFDDCMRFAELIGCNKDWQLESLLLLTRIKKSRYMQLGFAEFC
ncbi:hypothetical protein G9A89_021915 [Geosiphon pyriformis]|nr:hypothetical protein G9A89_021915 [Geosiphon pyriformis]